jgi:twitching motility protein PilT
MIRIDGSLRPLGGYTAVTKDQATDIVVKTTTEERKKAFLENKSLDFSRAIPGVARFRCAYFVQQSLMSLVFRRIPDIIPSLADVKAPSIFLEWARLPRGLVLVTGPTGSGKSTTLAAVIDVINSERADHILTIEDPIEFVHQPKRCVINQREIGRDAPNFSQALRGALRQDPDVILVGEMRDLETIATAITAAETGHLVFGTLHTSTAESTVSRIIDQYPADQQQQIRVMLAASLVGVVTQTLLPRCDGPGRIACHEVMVCNTAVRAHIRHQQMEQVRGVMQTQTQIGMQTMDRCLAYYVHQGILAEDIARERAVQVDEFDHTLASFRQGKDVAIPQIVQPGQGSMVRPGVDGGGTLMAMPPPSALATPTLITPAPTMAPAKDYAPEGGEPMIATAPTPTPAPAPTRMSARPPMPAPAAMSGADAVDEEVVGGADFEAGARAAAAADEALKVARTMTATPPMPTAMNKKTQAESEASRFEPLVLDIDEVNEDDIQPPTFN